VVLDKLSEMERQEMKPKKHKVYERNGMEINDR